MNLKEAIEILKRKNYIVTQIGDKYRVKEPCTPNEPRFVKFTSIKKLIDINNKILSSRELIKWAKIYTSDNNQETKLKSLVKFCDHRKNRRKTRQLIKHELYDRIPSKKNVHKENIRNWDHG